MNANCFTARALLHKKMELEKHHDSGRAIRFLFHTFYYWSARYFVLSTGAGIVGQSEGPVSIILPSPNQPPLAHRSEVRPQFFGQLNKIESA